MVIQNGCQKWKEHDEISKVANFEANYERFSESSKNLKDLSGWVARLATQPDNVNPLKFSNFQTIYHKISRLSNRGLKIGNLTNFIILFPSLATILYYHLFLIMIDMARFGHVTLSCKEHIRTPRRRTSSHSMLYLPFQLYLHALQSPGGKEGVAHRVLVGHGQRRASV